MPAFDLVAAWPAAHAAVGVARPGEVLASTGDVKRIFEWASVTKVLTALTTLVGVEDRTVALDDPAGPPGSTVRHLLAHASGLDFDGGIADVPPGARRIYSNG